MADFVAAIGPRVPVEVGARIWHRRKHGAPLGTESQRTFLALHYEAARYGISTQGRLWNCDTVFTVTARACQGCGKLYLGAGKQLCCSYACAWKSRGETADMARDDQRDDQSVPEIRALSYIVRGLRLLPDQATRKRVLEFATAMQIDPEPARAQSNGHTEDFEPDLPPSPSGVL